MVGSGLRDEGRRELGTAQAPKASGRFCWCCRRWLLGYGESSMRPQRHIFWMQFVMAALRCTGLLGCWAGCGALGPAGRVSPDAATPASSDSAQSAEPLIQFQHRPQPGWLPEKPKTKNKSRQVAVASRHTLSPTHDNLDLPFTAQAICDGNLTLTLAWSQADSEGDSTEAER